MKAAWIQACRAAQTPAALPARRQAMRSSLGHAACMAVPQYEAPRACTPVARRAPPELAYTYATHCARTTCTPYPCAGHLHRPCDSGCICRPGLNLCAAVAGHELTRLLLRVRPRLEIRAPPWSRPPLCANAHTSLHCCSLVFPTARLLGRHRPAVVLSGTGCRNGKAVVIWRRRHGQDALGCSPTQPRSKPGDC